MLLKLREKTTGWIAGAIVALLIVPFALVGIGDYFSTAVESWVAKVGESEISQDQFRARFEEYRQQMRRSMGASYDAAQMEQASVKRRVLDRMVDEELLRQSAERLGMTVPAARLQKEIGGISAFQVDGRFSADQYRLLLTAQNMTPRGFESRLRQDLLASAIPENVVGTGFATVADVERFIALRDQQRDLQYIVIEPPALEQIAEPGADEVQAYYDGNAARYMTEEQATIEYVVLDQNAVAQSDIVADESTLRQRYDENRSRYVEPEQRLASHILIRVPANADADTQRAAQERAAALAEQAQAAGADFAELARSHSEDPGSKAAGGDLGWLEQGMTDPAFESALFALNEGEVSQPVSSSEGWHVIQLRDLREGKERPFEDVRPELEQEFLAGERERRFNDLAGRLVDAIYRDPTSLQSAADELGLELQQAGPFGRAGGETALTAESAVLDAVFSQEVLIEGNVSDLLDLGDGRMVAVRVTEHLRSQPIPLDQVREQVAAELRAERRAEQAEQRAEALLAQLRDGTSFETVAAEAEVQVQTASDIRRTAIDVDQAIVAEAFRVPHPDAGSASFARVELGGDRQALLAVTEVVDGDPQAVSAAERSALSEQLAQVVASVELEGLMQALREQLPVRIAEERL